MKSAVQQCMSIDDRYDKVLAWFQENVPDPRTELDYDSPFHLLVAVILSAQCSDKRVNMVTPALFAAFPTPVSLATATEARVLEYVKSVSYPNNKTRHLIHAAKMLNEEFDCEVPSDIDSLLRLPGVGRKTANVILSVVWNRAAMAVDTHVFRVSHRLGFTRNCRTPFETEQELCRHIPEHLIAKAHHWFILHGRYVCTARQPHCDKCGLAQYCMAYSDNSEQQ